MIPPRVLQWRPLCYKYATTHPVLTSNEIMAIIWEESCGDPNAVNPSDPSWGLMQVTLPIGHRYSMALVQADLLKPDTNIMAGSGFLAYLKTKYAESNPITDPNCAWVSAYNQGEPNMLRGRADSAYIAAFVEHLAELNAQ